MPSTNNPIEMVMFCPSCLTRHIDAGEFAEKPHHTHACQECDVVWRPAVENTVGVQFLPVFHDEQSAGEEADEPALPSKGIRQYPSDPDYIRGWLSNLYDALGIEDGTLADITRAVKLLRVSWTGAQEEGSE